MNDKTLSAAAIRPGMTASNGTVEGDPGLKPSPDKGWLSSLAVLPGIGAALLPVLTCPACWPAYAGLLSALGLNFANYTPYLLPLTIVLLLVAVGALGYHAVSRRQYGPLSMGIAGSVILVAGKFALDRDLIMYGGIALLVAASVWNAWPRKTGVVCELPSKTTSCGCVE